MKTTATNLSRFDNKIISSIKGWKRNLQIIQNQSIKPKMMRLIGLFCLSVAYIGFADSICSCQNPTQFNVKIAGINMQFPCSATRNIYTQTGRYISKNVIATRAQFYRDNVIVAFPRLRQGIPFTLGTFSLRTSDCRPTVVPFPCWSIQEEGNCEALQNVVDIAIDGADTLWALDVGVTNTLDQPVRRCSPKVVAINAQTGQVVKIIDLTPFTSSETRFTNLVVEPISDGRIFILISDSGTGAIVSYDVYNAMGYRVVLPKQVVAGCGSMDSLSIALIRNPTGGNVLYFSYLNSPRLYYVKLLSLLNGQLAGSIVDAGAKPNPIVILGTDNGVSIFFRYKGESDVYVWNTQTCFNPQNFVLVQNGGDVTLPTHVVSGYKNLMWVLESNFQDYLNNTQGSLGVTNPLHPLMRTNDD